MRANVARLSRRMDELGLAAVVATTPENVYYLTGIANISQEVMPHTAQCYAMVARDRPDLPYLVIPLCDADQALDAEVPLASVAAFGEFHRAGPDGADLTPDEARLRILADGAAGGPLDALAATLRRAGVSGGAIAVDETGVPHGFLDELREALPSADIRAGAGLLRWTRKVKTAEEADRLARAAAVTERGILAALAAAEPGATEGDLLRAFDRTVAGAGGRPRFTLIKFGRHGVAGQRLPAGTPLCPGDAIWFDVGGVYQGYWSDLARVYCLGEPPPKLVRYHAAVRAGVDRAISAARPGMTGKELFDITVEAVRESGIPHYRRQHTGHGIGVEVYEPVLIAPGSTDRLEAGCVVNIETPYHELGFGAVQVEDPFVVGASANTVLTTLGRDLTTVEETLRKAGERT